MAGFLMFDEDWQRRFPFLLTTPLHFRGITNHRSPRSPVAGAPKAGFTAAPDEAPNVSLAVDGGRFAEPLEVAPRRCSHSPGAGEMDGFVPFVNVNHV